MVRVPHRVGELVGRRQPRFELRHRQARFGERLGHFVLRRLARLEQHHLHARIDVDRAIAVGLDGAEDRARELLGHHGEPGV